MNDLGDRIERIRADWYDFPAWVNEAAPPNPRAPSSLNDEIDFYTVAVERDVARSEVAQLRHDVESLIALAVQLHDETGCAEPCSHLALLEELAL